MSQTQKTHEGLRILVVRSAAQYGGEEKDQDRAIWSPATQTACVCDGVSSSPFSEQAAQVATEFSPVLFHDEDNVESNLRVLSDLLTVKRLEAQQAEVKTGSGVSATMQALLEEVARENLTRSFQTTLVAASFLPTRAEILARYVVVGDSAFFAFASDGEVLVTSLQSPAVLKSSGRQAIPIEPGTQLLVKVLCDASERPQLAHRAGIRPGSAGNWLVCRALDCLAHSEHDGPGGVPFLGPNALILAPRYLAEAPLVPRYAGYRLIRYSKAVRLMNGSRPVTAGFRDKTAVTAVLPDHFRAGRWTYGQEQFPADAQFVLATDGFYECFRDAGELWEWFQTHEENLSNEDSRRPLLTQLHARRYARQGDDDISFVWVRHIKPVRSDPETATHEETEEGPENAR